MSLFARSYNRFTGGSAAPSPPSTTATTIRNEQNITHRKKLSAVSTSIHGDDGMVAASPRNRHPPTSIRNRQHLQKDDDDDDQIDGAGMSAMTPVEQKAAELRRKMEIRNHAASIESVPPTAAASLNQTASSSTTTTTAPAMMKKPRTSTSSLASVFRSRASSPIEKMRKFIGRSSSSKAQKASAAEKDDEIEQLREKLRLLEMVQKAEKSQQCDQRVTVDVGVMTDFCQIDDNVQQQQQDKENVDPSAQKRAASSPEIILLDESLDNNNTTTTTKSTIESLQRELVALREHCDEQTEDFRRTRRDFITILREAVRRKDEAEQLYEKLTKSIADEEDWSPLMSQNRHTVRRTVLLTWAQKKLEPYSEELQIGNFSSDWTDGRAFCALIYEMFPHLMPDVTISPIIGDCIARCRAAFAALEICFEERALGLTGAESTDDSSTVCSSICLPDWRYVMDTVFEIYKKGNRC